jgi:hypothetical protein
MKQTKSKYRLLLFILFSILAFAVSFAAQTTAFNYQGRLTDAGNPANGAYQVLIKLFDTPAGANPGEVDGYSGNCDAGRFQRQARFRRGGFYGRE